MPAETNASFAAEDHMEAMGSLAAWPDLWDMEGEGRITERGARRLNSYIESAKEAFALAITRAENAEASLKLLKVALQPFAEEIVEIDGSEIGASHDDDVLWDVRHDLTWGDFRRARAVIDQMDTGRV